MQYPVPQFTDVEDKIIGPLSIKQFMILFVAGIFIFLAYSASKSVLVTMFIFMLLGVPALGLAFGKVNGRPIYSALGNFVRFLQSPKILIFHKEAASGRGNFKNLSLQNEKKLTEEKKPTAVSDTKANLQTVMALLNKTEKEELKLIHKQN